MTPIVKGIELGAGGTPVGPQIARTETDQRQPANSPDCVKLLVLSQPVVLAANELEKLEIHASGPVSLRRDLHLFLKYLELHEIKRSHRLNEIPKSDEQRLSKLLSFKGQWSQKYDKCDSWSDYLSRVARTLGLVSFDTEGVYLGEFSQSKSFPDNYIRLNETAWNAYLDKTPVQKERALLESLLSMTGNEFFGSPTLIEGSAFSSQGSADGPASKMNLPMIRRALLSALLDLKPDVWYSTAYAIELLRKTAPNLILDPATREPDFASRKRLRDWEWATRGSKHKPATPKPELTFEDIYVNFSEYKPGDEFEIRPRTITSAMPNSFERVEGRYLEYFLREIPFILGYVDLAFRSGPDKTGLDVEPPLGCLRGFRLSSRFFAIYGQDNAWIDAVKTTVLPNFELVIEAVSYPDRLLEAMSPYTTIIKDEPPIHRLKLDRKKVVEATAALAPSAKRIQDLLVEASGAALPANVASELGSWTAIAERVTLYDNVSLLELLGDHNQKQEILLEIAEHLVDDRLKKFIVVRDSKKVVLSRLEEKHHVPVKVIHREDRLTAWQGAFTSSSKSAKKTGAQSTVKVPKNPEPESISVEPQDVVCYRITHKAFLTAVRKELEEQIATRSTLIVSGDLIILSAGELPQWRAALRKLSGKYNVRS